MSNENLKQVRKYIDETISKTIKASRKLNANYFKMTERRLYAYPMLEQNIEMHQQDIEDIKKEVFGHSKDIVVYSPTSSYGDKPDVEEVRQERIKFVREKIWRDREELKEVKRALERIKDDEYYKVIELHYFKHVEKEEIAKILKCSEITAWRQKKRLVSTLSLALYGAEALK